MVPGMFSLNLLQGIQRYFVSCSCSRPLVSIVYVVVPDLHVLSALYAVSLELSCAEVQFVGRF